MSEDMLLHTACIVEKW